MTRLQQGLCIAGDWGSSRMRLHLCRRDVDGFAVLDSAAGPGAKDVADHEAAFFDAASPWIAAHGPMPVVLVGMVGSTIGWREVPYAPCPAGAADLAARLDWFEARGLPLAIVPGLACTNIFGLPDVMRGEEAQLFGWLARVPDDEVQRVLCLPGTHAKWVRARGRRVVDFFTSMQGELHALLLAHGLLGRSLARPHDPAAPVDTDEFDRGLTLIAGDPTLSIEHAVFSLRSRILADDLASDAAASYLSGLLIGAEVRDGWRALAARGQDGEALVLIGTGTLVELHTRACARLGIEAVAAVDHDLAITGLTRLAFPDMVPA